jgi:hypothetical protein
MQYLVLQRADARTETDDAAPLPGMQALLPTVGALRLTLADGQATITEGPFADPYATVAGFGVIEAQSTEEALEKARAWPLPDGVDSAELEVRLGGCPGGCAAIPDPGAPQQGKRFAIVLRSSPVLEREDPVPQARLDALNAHNAAEVAAGRLISASGLRSTAHGARVKRSRTASAVFDGPFTEIKELIAGYWMVQVPSVQDAIAWALKNPYPTGPSVEVEIREVRPQAPRPFTAEVQALEARMREAQLESALRAELAGGR